MTGNNYLCRLADFKTFCTLGRDLVREPSMDFPRLRNTLTAGDEEPI